MYIRSFADGNGDGVGDLRGLKDRLEHLAWLGVDIVWITPFYPSPMFDFGYDVADYTAVDPLFGTLDEFDAVVDEATRLGLRVVIDIVPNHTSIEHAWFRAARSSKTDPKRSYYIWRDAPADGSHPNNWVGYFGGPAWTYDEASGQYYLHLFLPEQPDLNWRNPSVIEEFDRILRFWLERGVSGFRIDVAQALVKDEQLRSNPELSPVDFDADRHTQWAAFAHDHDVTQDDTLAIFKRWRAIVEEYDGILIGETYVLEPDVLAGMLRGDGLHVAFWFKTMHMEWNAETIAQTLAAPLDSGSDEIGWVQASHDEPRPPTRFGGGTRGRRRSLGLSTLLLGLPGLPFLYQGEELAIEDGIVPPEMKADPVGGDEVDAGRDGCRTPMPWSAEPGKGFTTAPTPWLPSSHDPDDTVAVQRGDPSSPLHRTRQLIELRRQLDHDAPVEWLDPGTGLVAFRRGDFEFFLNAGDDELTLHTECGALLYSSITPDRVGTISSSRVRLEPDEAVVLR